MCFLDLNKCMFNEGGGTIGLVNLQHWEMNGGSLPWDHSTERWGLHVYPITALSSGCFCCSGLQMWPLGRQLSIRAKV